MKYPSVFLVIFFAWLAMVWLAISLHTTETTYRVIYLPLMFFTVGIFLIGFWRNR